MTEAPPEVASVHKTWCEQSAVDSSPCVDVSGDSDNPVQPADKAEETDKAATTEIFPRLSVADLHELQTQDQIIGPVIAAWPAKPSLSKESPMRTLVQQYPRLFLRDGVLYRRQTDQPRGVLEQLALPSALRPDVIAAVHEKMGHQGYEGTMELLRSRVYWPGMYGEVKDYIDSCERCTMGRALVIHTTSNHLLASRPLEILVIDFTKMETASDGKEDVLTDVFTKFSLAIPVSNQEAVTIAKVLVRDWFQRYGVPQRIQSGQGRKFESKLVSALCELYGIHKIRPHHTIHVAMPSANDLIAFCMICYALFPKN